ncbi:MAG: reverse gyrase [Candidatus Aenigmatarchaeota archaeon]
MLVVYENSCPNCGGRISYERLINKLPCESCIKNISEEIKKLKPNTKKFYKKILRELKSNYTLKNYINYVKIILQTDDFLKFFKKAINSNAWSAQRMWATRIFKNLSFAIMAPTGSGKTTFLIVLSLYMAYKHKKKIYFILPTSLLASQVYDKFKRLAESLNLDLKIVTFNSILKKKEREEAIEKIKNKEFQILITTNMFLSKKFEMVKDFNFDIIIVDDVDSFLRASKNINKVLNLLGFGDEVIEKALENIELRRSLMFANEEERKEKEKKIEENKNFIKKFSYKNKVLVVSGASARARTKRVMLFNELLGFQIGTKIEGIRNVEDVYELVKENLEEKIFEYVKKIGKGGLIFVPADKGIEYAKKLEEFLVSKGIKAKTLEKTKLSIIKDFIAGNLDVLIGIASYKSPLARGIDLPDVIRYAIFTGPPKFKIKIDISEFKPSRILALLLHIREYLEKKEEKDKLDVLSNKLRKISGLTEENLKTIINAIKENKQLEGFLEHCREILKDSYEFIKSLLSNEKFVKKLRESKKLSFGESEDKFYFIIADVQAYIQASGRTSRLYAGGISKGLSLVLVDDEKAFNSLKEKIKWFDEKANFKNLNEIDLEEIIREIDKDRETIKALKEGKIEPKKLKDLLKIGLLIVESPTKAKTISKFFGTPAIREIDGVRIYEVSSGDYILLITSSIGHVFDLVIKDGFHGVLIKDDNFIPVYGTIKTCQKCKSQYTDNITFCPIDNEKLFNKIKILNVLRDLSQEVDEILIATDPDAEGEKIGFDIANFLSPFVKKIKRLEFHEITYKAIRNALNNPREINLNLVKSQIVRRIEDRWFGFELSQKVQKEFKKKTLSAGRVQTPVLGWIVKRTEESKNSLKDYLRVYFDNLKVVFEFEKLAKKEKEKFFEEIIKNRYVLVEKIEQREETLNPLPPYTTDSLLKDASNILKFSTEKTMRIAQELFESGLITYHRTDSTTVSTAGINIAKEYIIQEFGEELFFPRPWTKEGAHECIRPTKAIDAERLLELLRLKILQIPIILTKNHLALYDLIFKRFIASQMKSAKVEKTKFKFKLLNLEREEEFITKILDKGFTKITKIKETKISEGKYEIVRFDAEKDYFRKPSIPLFSQGDVISLMKEKGIGRPSTYTSIIAKILERRYVISVKNKLIATKRGKQVFEYLKSKFEKYISEELTRDLERKMDLIEENKVDYIEVLKEIYRETMEIKQIK